MDYLRRWNIPCYTTAKLYHQIEVALTGSRDPHTDDLSFINSMVGDGATITGKSSFPTEEKDLIFLAGNLAIRGYARILVLVENETYFSDSKRVMRDHNDVFKSLATLGYSVMTCKFDCPNGFIALIKYVDPEYYSQNPV